MNKFKVGDIVRVKRTSTCGCGAEILCMDCMPGKLEVIRLPTGSDNRYSCKAVDNRDICGFCEEDIELDKVNWKDLFENGGGN